jgi:hypothetical protein
MQKLVFMSALLPALLIINVPYLTKAPFQAPMTQTSPLPSTPGTAHSSLYVSLRLHAAGLSQTAFNDAVAGYNALVQHTFLIKKQILVIADFTQSSAKKRLYVIDMRRGRLLLNTYVAHGQQSGEAFATRFSNTEASQQSSLGFYTTLDPYMGSHGYSLRLRGCEKGINDRAYERDIVVHGAPYMNPAYIKAKGYAGRSHGCPAVPESVSTPLINMIKAGACFFVYHPTPAYRQRTQLLNG